MKKQFTLKRIYTEQKLSTQKIICIDSSDKLHHLKTVLRAKTGESVRLFNAKDGEWLGAIYEISKKHIAIQVQTFLRHMHDTLNVKLAIPPIKHHRLATLMEKCTEIGVNGFILMHTERTVKHNKINSNKLNAYITNATEQSERITTPSLTTGLALKDLFSNYQDHKIIFCHPRHTHSTPLAQALKNIDFKKKILLIIGPEGGFADRELELAEQNHASTISLGTNILRTETASIFAASCVFAFGEAIT